MTRQRSQSLRKKKVVSKRSRNDVQQKKRRFSAHIELVSNPIPTSRIYRETDLQIHAKAHCLVGLGGNRDQYVVHFVREKTALNAMTLKIGDQIIIEEATFNEYPPHSRNIEIHARAFRRV